MYNPTLRGLDSHMMMLSYRLLLVDRQALSEHTTTSSSTESFGQALRVSLVKPGAYLSESYRANRSRSRRAATAHATGCYGSTLTHSPSVSLSFQANELTRQSVRHYQKHSGLQENVLPAQAASRSRQQSPCAFCTRADAVGDGAIPTAAPVPFLAARSALAAPWLVNMPPQRRAHSAVGRPPQCHQSPADSQSQPSPPFESVPCAARHNHN